MNKAEKASANTSVDLLVVGSGAGALAAALTAAAAGRKVLVIEKMPALGGTSAMSGGALWIPCNSVMREAGIEDNEADAWKYFDTLIGDVGIATSQARKKTFLGAGPRMVDFLRTLGVEFRACKDYPDYYAGHPGGRPGGRSIECPMLDGRELGADLQRLKRRNNMPEIAVCASDLGNASNGMRTLASVRANLRIVFRTLGAKLRGRVPLTMGMALIGRLLLAAQKQGIEFRTSTPLLRLLTDPDGKVIGAVTGSNSGEKIIHARDGVILACGGFASNAEMRAMYQPMSSTHWTSAPTGDEGDGIRSGQAVGADVAQMDEAWWMPTSVLPDGTTAMCIERAKPYSIFVGSSGERFMNEAAPYMEAGQQMLRRQRECGDVMPSWMILDARHRQYYPLSGWMPGRTPQEMVDSGYIIRAQTLDELAKRCNIDSSALARTVERFNRMCATGIDEDFHRGDNPYDHHFGDARVGPNSTMGPIEQAPFYAIAMYPGDIGTNGGLLTDEYARVLREDGVPIAGLYATGNCTASVMGRTYPGAGATIGPSMVFGYVGANHACGL